MEGNRGFSVVEILVVLLLIAILLSWAAGAFNGYQQRVAARRAAEVFVQDLNVTKTEASRSRRVTVLDFDEGGLGYVVRMESGDTILRRSYDDQAEIPLTFLDLQTAGDTLAFDRQGQADLGGTGAALGRAVFSRGNTSFTVSFNSMGVARIEGT
ncbi:MAG: prepilin-type N-terminal cleavage/methylation domain-containing protein [Gemmatimonadetes bacterium]|nr:prepilin-type N-terminal cleavage/methylation domain-containing protein [Gemmatimonadota bacterium]